jgi:uncharacterized protein YjiS (DUF1127 family)
MSVETLNNFQLFTSGAGKKVKVPATTGLLNLVETVQIWLERMNSRRELARLDDRMLQDIGIDRADVDLEVEKPFWVK